MVFFSTRVPPDAPDDATVDAGLRIVIEARSTFDGTTVTLISVFAIGLPRLRLRDMIQRLQGRRVADMCGKFGDGVLKPSSSVPEQPASRIPRTLRTASKELPA